jgi:hypothetical protein
LLKIIKNRPTFAWKVSVYIIKRAAAQAAFSPEKVYHVGVMGFRLRVLVLAPFLWHQDSRALQLATSQLI